MTPTWRVAALAFCALMVWSLENVDTARADDIIVSADALAGPGQTSAGTGLDGRYYYNGLGMAVNNENGVDDFRASILAANPGLQGTFKGLRLNWTGGDTTAVNAFMGADGASLTPAITHTLNTSYFDMTGYINVPTAGKYTFHTNSDDASFVLIAGQQVVNNGMTHGGQDATGTATFHAAGLYPIEILYSNQDFTNNGMVSQGGANFTYDSTLSGDAGTGNHTALYSGSVVPEASSLSLAALGIISLLGYALRWRKQSA